METEGKRSMREDGDRISHLPVEVIHHILSSLDTISAVRFCVLSKRWVSLWKSLPFLQFSDDTLPQDLLVEEGDKVFRPFNIFILQVIAQRYPTNLERVSLRCTHDPIVDELVVQYLISHALQRNVQHLEVYSPSGSFFAIEWFKPKNFYDSQSLTALTHKKYFNFLRNTIQFPEYTFPALKSLDLSGFWMMEPAFTFDTSIFSSYPNLETLKLSRFWLHALGQFRIHALNLRKLVISELDERLLVFPQDRAKPMLEIHAPKLTTFEYSGQLCIVNSTPRLTSLDDVCFDTISTHYQIEKEDVFYVIILLKEFDHAKSLTLSMDIIEVLSKCPAALLDNYQLSFANLKYLKLKVHRDKGYDKELQIPEHVLNCFGNDYTLLKICS